MKITLVKLHKSGGEGEFEECGYKFFYEPTDEEIADDLDANDFEFLEDGTIF